MKKLIGIIIGVLAISSIAFAADPSPTAQYWRRSGDTLYTIPSDLGLSIGGDLNVDGALTLGGTMAGNLDMNDHDILNASSVEIGGMIYESYAATLADDATIVLPTEVAGLLTVWIGDWQEYAREVMIKTDGTVTTTSTSSNVATTDSDGNLCIYDSGSGATIKNRLGSSLTVKYEFKY